MNKIAILDLIGFIIIFYALALGFVFLTNLINFTDQIMIFVVMPLPYTLAIYLYYAKKELKRYAERNLTSLAEDNNKQAIQIANYSILDNVRIDRIKKYEIEISELKVELSNVAKKEKDLIATVDGVDQFNKIFKENESILLSKLNVIKGIVDKNMPSCECNAVDSYITIPTQDFYDIDDIVNNKIPFNQDNDNVEQQWICPSCNVPMTRQTDKIIFCDNPSCTRKQWKKGEL